MTSPETEACRWGRRWTELCSWQQGEKAKLKVKTQGRAEGGAVSAMACWSLGTDRLLCVVKKTPTSSVTHQQNTQQQDLQWQQVKSSWTSMMMGQRRQQENDEERATTATGRRAWAAPATNMCRGSKWPLKPKKWNGVLVMLIKRRWWTAACSVEEQDEKMMLPLTEEEMRENDGDECSLSIRKMEG